MQTITLDPSQQCEQAAVLTATIRAGGVAVVPTDTVYGLVCDARNERAKRRIYEIKGRRFDKPLIGFVGSVQAARRVCRLSEDHLRIVNRAWPGATTFLLPAAAEIPLMTSPAGEIGLRMPDHQLLLTCLNETDLLASTSANVSGEGACRSLDRVPDAVKEAVDLCIDGGKTPRGESAIWRLTPQGPLLVRGTVLFVCEGNTCRSPMAEHLLRQALAPSGSINVISAGLMAPAGTPISRLAIEVLAEQGIDARSSVTTPVSQHLLRTADLVFVMTDDQKERVEILWNRNVPTVVPVISLNVDDPAGGDGISAYRKVRDILVRQIEKVVLTRIAR